MDHTLGTKDGHYVYVDASNGVDYDYAYLVSVGTYVPLVISAPCYKK